MDVYYLTFAVLVVACCWTAWSRHRHQLETPAKEMMKGGLLESHGDATKFRKTFLLVYLLVMASDWLQVPLVQLYNGLDC